ncbi:hypothetical protein [Sphingopyxis sp.]|uniref:hypothetical protein n=1 Tax=Sphingopyxis sp. TaxID=1908224 RepID=UPI003D0FC24C
MDESLRHAEAIYHAVHRSSVDSATIYQLMGFSGKTGTSAKALGSLRQYGLIEGIGEKTRISDLALAILEPESASEKSSAIRTSSKSPDVFGEVLTRFDGRVPQADEAIRAFLIRELGFQKNSADECIKALRQSLAYADSFSRDSEVSPQPISVEAPPLTEIPPTPEPDKEVQREVRSVDGELVIIPLTKECRAELRIVGKLNARAIKNLIRHIDLLADVWAEDEDELES